VLAEAVQQQIKIVEDIREKMDTDNITFLTLLDYSKAFYSVNDEILSVKFKRLCNFSRASVQLIYSFLSNRGQSVFVNNAYSSCNRQKEAFPTPQSIYILDQDH